MLFKSNGFKCDVDVYRSSDGVALRFYDQSKEQSEEEICVCVFVQPPFGYLSLKFVGEAGEGLISGYLNADVFDKPRAEDALELLENLVDPDVSFPSHITLLNEVDYIEYNGEY